MFLKAGEALESLAERLKADLCNWGLRLFHFRKAWPIPGFFLLCGYSSWTS